MKKSTSSGVTWMIPRETPLVLRTSFLKMYLRCPAQAMFRYFKGLVMLPRSYTTFGTCLHKSAEHQNLYKKTSGKVIKLSVAQDIFNEEFKERRKSTQWDKDEDANKILEEGVKKCVPLYHGKAKEFEPIHVEEQVILNIPEANVTITGTLDLATKGDLIRDLKTKSRSPNWLDPIKSLQKTFYSIGYKEKFKKAPKGFVLDTVVRKKDPEFLTSEMQLVKPGEEEQFKQMVIRITQCVRMGMFFPKKEGNMFCSPNLCGYWKICHAGAWMKVPEGGQTFMGNTAKDGTLEADNVAEE